MHSRVLTLTQLLPPFKKGTVLSTIVMCQKTSCIYVRDQLKTWPILKPSDGPDGFEAGPTASKRARRFSNVTELSPTALKPAGRFRNFEVRRRHESLVYARVLCLARCEVGLLDGVETANFCSDGFKAIRTALKRARQL